VIVQSRSGNPRREPPDKRLWQTAGEGDPPESAAPSEDIVGPGARVAKVPTRWFAMFVPVSPMLALASWLTIPRLGG
jgi:hypothetical protein